MPSTPSGMSRSTVWNEDVEEAYRFQLAGWRDAAEYATVKLINLKTVWFLMCACYLFITAACI